MCHEPNPTKVLDLGMVPLANSFLNKEDLENIEEKFPLVVYFCEKCFSLQLLDVVDPEILFKHYVYFTSASKPLVEHFQETAKYLVKRFIKDKSELVVEIGGNDGTLLDVIKNDCRILNIEPAANVAEESKKKGIETIVDFFNEDLGIATKKEYGGAKLVIANNVMAHIPEIDNIFKGVFHLLGEDGVFVFEVHWVGNLLGDGGFDQIYHEHLFYHSLHALNKAISRFGLTIFDVELIPIHGQSVRVFAGKNRAISRSVEDLLKMECELGLDKVETFLKFSKKIEKNKSDLLSLLQELKKQNKKIIGYGAPAKGNTLLNYFGINSSIIDYIVDTTISKQGTYTPGTHILVKSPETLKEEVVDYIVLFAWNYADAILEKEKELRRNGVKFIIPVPEVRVI